MPTPVRARRQDRPIELGKLNEHLGYFVRRLQLWIFQDFTRGLADLDIRPAQYSVLVVVASNLGPSQAEIAKTLGIERARLVRMLDRLEMRGLTRRRPAAGDRRSHAIELTPAGRCMLDQCEALVNAHERRLIKRLGAPLHQTLLTALRDEAGRS